MKVIKTNEGKEIKRISRWIKVKQNYNPSKRNSLYCYVNDGHGYYSGSNSFDPISHNGSYLDYFTFNGRNYAINQFMRLDYPIFFENKEGKTSYISGYDVENYYNPIMIEIDEYGEYVRVYEEC